MTDGETVDLSRATVTKMSFEDDGVRIQQRDKEVFLLPSEAVELAIQLDDWIEEHS